MKHDMLLALTGAKECLVHYIETMDWKSLLINYEPPTVERVFTDLPDGNRLSLHVIHPCEQGEVFFHPHPWPSAVLIVSGSYKMDVGYSKGLKRLPVAMSVILRERSFYEMSDPNAWHSVQPLDAPSYSIMVNGPSLGRPMPKTP